MCHKNAFFSYHKSVAKAYIEVIEKSAKSRDAKKDRYKA